MNENVPDLDHTDFDPTDFDDTAIDQRARQAVAKLRLATAVRPPEVRDLVRSGVVRRVGRAAALLAALVVVGAGVVAVTSSTPPDAALWVTGALLGLLLVATWALCAHAGGHAWLVPLPALVLAVAWAASTGHGADGWWYAATSAAAAGGGISIGATALRQRLRSPLAALPPLQGAVGTAVTALAPTGIVLVRSETWTAESVSGPLPAGVEVHVVRVEGVRLVVWSEAGTVPDGSSLSPGQEREEGDAR